MKMRMTNILAASALLFGLSTAAYAEMGKCGGGGMQKGMKCGGGMMMKGDFNTVKSHMLKNLGEMQKCVESAASKEDLKKCKMKMMQKRKEMMQNKAPAAKKGQCGAGKCGGGK